MLAAVSDYDGTIRRGGAIAPDTLAAIRDWRAGGNIFGIATGRDLSMLRQELDCWSLTCDFYACDNGAAVYDSTRKPIITAELDPAAAVVAMRHPAGRASLHLLLLADAHVYFHQIRDDSWFPGMKLPHTPVSYGEALEVKRMQQISLAYTCAEETASWTAGLRAALAGRLEVHQNIRYLDLTAPGVDKAWGFARAMEIRGWKADRVLAFGDGENDICMLREHEGYTVPEGSAAVRQAARGVTETVGEVLRRAMREEGL